MADYAYIKKQDYVLGYLQENIELVLYSLICFFAPFLIGHPQIVVGVLVNAALILAALNLKDFKLLPMIMIPSLAVLSRGMIFGPFTIFLVYMIPFIWIGNAILVWSFKKFNLGLKINRWITLVIGSILKTAFLFGCAFVFFKLGILPVLFLTTMGLLQLYTAILGGILAIGIQSIKKNLV
jgi:hypothetical protein